MIRVQPIVFTSHLDKWEDLLTALGMNLLLDEPKWKVFEANHGRLALHKGGKDRLELWFDSDHAETCVAALEAAGGTIKEMDLGDGVVVHEAHFDSVVTGISSAVVGDDIQPSTGNGLSVFPLWYTSHVDRAISALKGLGLQPRISSDGGGWADFRADEGLVAVHRADHESAGLAFEYTESLDDLQARLGQAGIQSRRIDENFGATLRIDHPDGGDELWINAPQDDLYGYHQHEA